MIRRWIGLIGLSVFAAFLIRTFLVETVSVASGSMEPTLFQGTHYLVNRLTYRLREPKRGDIVVFTNPVDQKTGMIKRVIAVPGDIVELRRKQVFLNGRPVREPYTVYKRSDENLQGDNIGPLTVPAESVFVLGDNRDESLDSSVWKDAQSGKPVHFVPYRNIKGRLIRIP